MHNLCSFNDFCSNIALKFTSVLCMSLVKKNWARISYHHLQCRLRIDVVCEVENPKLSYLIITQIYTFVFSILVHILYREAAHIYPALYSTCHSIMMLRCRLCNVIHCSGYISVTLHNYIVVFSNRSLIMPSKRPKLWQFAGWYK